MEIAALKEQARALEQSGEAAAALTIYDEILEEYERLALQPDGTLYVKIGDLSLKTGQRSRAIELFGRAADQYARDGSHKSVIALAIKLHRTDPKIRDAHVRYAKKLFRNGHLEATRLVLLDYAGRTGLEKTRDTLQRIGDRPDHELKAKLEEFFTLASRAGVRSGEQEALPQARSTALVSETREHLAIMAKTVMEEPRPARDPIMDQIRSSRPVEQPVAQAEPVPTELPAATPDLAVVAGAHPTVRKRRTFSVDRIRRTFSSSPARAWPVAAAAVLVIGLALMGFGAIPFGGDLDAKQPVSAPPAIATAATGGPAANPDLASSDSTAPTGLAGPENIGNDNIDPERRNVDAAIPTEPGTRPAVSRAPGPLTSLDRSALASVSEVAIQVGDVDIPLDSTVAADDPIVIPTSASLPIAPAGTAVPGSRPVQTATPVIAIEDLEITAVARSAASYQLVQRLSSGASVTLTVAPIEDAPAGTNGQLEVRAGAGNTSIGTRRFRDSFVTAQGPISAAKMEELLERLTERPWK